ncbi:MAG: HlyD family secretion protein [Alphaproteobacteria bacterium]|nr:HlyD family secretion protein [Alphaproteobacteria bacterium]
MKRLKLIAVLVLVGAIAGALVVWWDYKTVFPSTSDAYIQANIISVAAQVPGQVKRVEVQNYQFVKAGQVLFLLDDKNFRDAETGIQTQVKTLRDASGTFVRQINAAKAAVVSANVALQTADDSLERNRILFQKGDIARARLDQSQAGAARAQAGADAATARLAAARSTLVANREQLTAAQAQLKTARQNLAYTTVTAPADGWIANLRLRQGAVVGAYMPLFSLVENSAWWLEANFKETDLARIRDGQPATVSIDLFPGVKFQAKVSAIGAGSGATFSLLPPENATGNWVKVTQRFPVRLSIERGTRDLRVGASATVTIDTLNGETPWWMVWK